MPLHLLIYLIIFTCTFGSSQLDSANEYSLIHQTRTFLEYCQALTNSDTDFEQWNMLNNATIFKDLSFTDDQKLCSMDNYCILSGIPVDSDYACCFTLFSATKFTKNIQILSYDAQWNLLNHFDLTSNYVYFNVPEGTSYISITLPQNLLESALLIQDEKDNCYVVSKDKNTAFSTINQALPPIETEGVILLLPGTYHENVKAWGKKLHLIGVGSSGCILESSSGSYYAPPLEIAAGTVANLTIRSLGGYDDTHAGAYGIHIEHDSLCNETLKIQNCIISSNSNSAIGIGMRGGCQVMIKDCHLTGREYGLFCHDSAYSKSTGLQEMQIINCKIEGKTGTHALRFDSQGVPGATIKVLFQDNQLVSANPKSKDLLVTLNQGGKGSSENWKELKNYYLLPESTGNSEGTMNYK